MISNNFFRIKQFIYKNFFLKINSALIILIGFIGIIFLGALILSLPISSRNGQFTNFLNALFTATGSTCVTGRILYDTGTYWSAFGHFVIIFLIQIGGIGFMSVWVLFAIIIKKRVSPKIRLLMAQSININSSDGIFNLARLILFGTFMFEILGAAVLSVRFIPIFGVSDGIKMSIFHSISAFCNAGIDMMGSYSGAFSSMTAFYDDALINITLTSLTIIGGLGFFVWKDILDFANYILFKKERRTLSLYTKLVLTITAILIVLGTLLFLLAEWDNDGTIGLMSLKDKIMVSYFHSVSCRSSGFNTVNIDECHDVTKLLMIFLMFIGASSGSTGGGIKTVTFGVIIIAMFQISIGHSEIVIFKKTINKNHILRAVSLTSYVIMLGIAASAIISIFDNMGLLHAVFETMAALTTVGYTFSIVEDITVISKILLIVLMFIGRVGILTFTFGVLLRMSKKQTLVSYPEENIFIG